MASSTSFQPWRLLMHALLVLLAGTMLLVSGAAAADQGSDAGARLAASVETGASECCADEAAGKPCLACCVAHNQPTAIRTSWASLAPFAFGSTRFAAYVEPVRLIAPLYRDLDPPRS